MTASGFIEASYSLSEKVGRKLWIFQLFHDPNPFRMGSSYSIGSLKSVRPV